LGFSNEDNLMLNVNAVAKSPLSSVLKSRWLRVGIPVVILLFGFGGFGAKFLRLKADERFPWKALPSQSELITQRVVRQTIPLSIVANGTVNSSRLINLSPKTAGALKTLRVQEGDRVREGQVLATMDDANLLGEMTQMQGQLAQQEANLQALIAGNRPEDIAKAEAQLAEAEANLQQLRSGNRPQDIAQSAARLQQAQATLQQSETDVQRHQYLYREGAIARETLDQKITDRAVARTQVTEAEQGLALQKAGTRSEEIDQAQARVDQQAQAVALLKAGTRQEEIDQALAQVQSARGALQTVESQLKDTQIVAPFDGTVLKKYADVGSFVSPSVSGGTGTSSASILLLANDRLQVVVNLSEAQIAQVKLGQSVTIKADALPNEKFTGQVEQIAPQASVAQNVTSFEVRVAIDASDKAASEAALKVGMNVEAEFAVGQLENALVLPNAAVVRRAEGTGVYVLGRDSSGKLRGKPVFQPIQTGITAGTQTEVKSGLKENEQVLLSPPEEPAAGSAGISLPKAPAQ
jgi:HlyD family secretion protein